MDYQCGLWLGADSVLANNGGGGFRGSCVAYSNKGGGGGGGDSQLNETNNNMVQFNKILTLSNIYKIFYSKSFLEH